jgi:hypothetical protein
MHRIVLATLILVVIFITASSTSVGKSVGSIDLSANPTCIEADGKSISTIKALVRDRDGMPVPDGTEIRFTSSIGIIDETGTTSSGVAHVKLVSSNIKGSAVVTATWVDGQSVAQVNVEFGEPGSIAVGQQYISVDSDTYLGYSLDYKTLEAVGDVRVKYRALELEAREVQVDLDKNRLIARGDSVAHPLRLHTSAGILQGNLFTYDITSLQGYLLSAEASTIQRIDASKSVPEVTQSDTVLPPEEFDAVDISDSSGFIKAEQAVIFPNEKIQFRKATLYMNGKRVFTLPYYVLWMNGLGPDGQQYLSYGTSGITLNLPFYYSVTPSSSGAVVLRHGESTGWSEYGRQPGWFLDLRQQYSTGRSEGTLVMSEVTGGNWGAQLTHSQTLDDKTHAYMYLDYASHKDLLGTLNLNRRFDAFDVDLNLFGSKYDTGSKSLVTNLQFQTHSKPVGKLPLRYTISTQSEYAAGSASQSGRFSQSLHGSVYSRPIPMSKTLSIKSSLGLGYLWKEDGSGLSTLGTAVLDWKLSSRNSLQVSYRYTDRANISSSSGTRQSISARWTVTDGKKWDASLYALKGLDYSSSNFFFSADYHLNSDWRLGLRTTANMYDDHPYDDLELVIGRMLGGRELTAIWSRSRNKVTFELGSITF